MAEFQQVEAQRKVARGSTRLIERKKGGSRQELDVEVQPGEDILIRDVDSHEVFLIICGQVGTKDQAAQTLEDLQVCIESRPAMNRGKGKKTNGIMVGVGWRKGVENNFAGKGAAPYKLKKKYQDGNDGEDAERRGKRAALAVSALARVHAPEAWQAFINCMKFKMPVYPMFVSKNFKIADHTDKDRAAWAVAWALHEPKTKGQYIFRFPEYKLRIAVKHRMFWAWRSSLTHGTDAMDTSGGARFIGVVTISEQTAIGWEQHKEAEAEAEKVKAKAARAQVEEEAEDEESEEQEQSEGE